MPKSGSIPASSDTVESEGRQKKQCYPHKLEDHGLQAGREDALEAGLLVNPRPNHVPGLYSSKLNNIISSISGKNYKLSVLNPNCKKWR
jgi:hypothetical protein